MTETDKMFNAGERKILRRIYDPVLDNDARRVRKNEDLSIIDGGDRIDRRA